MDEITGSKVKEQLLFTYKYKIELHAHTNPVSGCSKVSPEEMAETYARFGYDAIVITDHFTSKLFSDKTKDEGIEYFLSGYENTKKAAEKSGLKVLLGAEVRFTENVNDYLIYGVDKNILSDVYDHFSDGVIKYRKEVKLPDSVFLQAHPFRDNMEPVPPEILDGIEIFNFNPPQNSRNAIAARYAFENGFKIRTVGSDFHNPARQGEALSALRTKTLPNDTFELAEILRSGDFIYQAADDVIILP